MPITFIESPLNYTGGKYKLLPQLLPLFPKNITLFVDLFCGGCNVGINVNAEEYIFNDLNSHLIGLLKKIQYDGAELFSNKIKMKIKQYNLSDTTEHNYSFYECDSSSGLGNYNRQHFMKLRQNFNSLKSNDEQYYYELYTLIIYAFNNQIRFNSNQEYNLPVGKRDFNLKMRKKLQQFANAIQEKNITFTNKNFIEFNLNFLNNNSFIYADPPYLITTATYNEKNAWTEKEEKELLHFLDKCDTNKIKFALSNVLYTDGKENLILKKWITTNKDKYFCHHLKSSYNNSNYHKKNAENKTDEVLIVNYKEPK